MRKGDEIKPEELMMRGYYKVSKYGYTNGDMNVILKRNRVCKMTGRQKFAQLIRSFSKRC